MKNENRKIQFRLHDYSGKLSEYNFLAVSNNDSPEKLIIVYTVQSGDEVVYVFDGTKKLATFDAAENNAHDYRMGSFLDELRVITPDELAALNKD